MTYGPAVAEVDPTAYDDAVRLHLQLTKPAGSLGRLEGLGCRLAAMAGRCPPPVPTFPAVAVFAGDHGVLAEGVSPWPAEVTGQMVANFAAGGAAINVLARQMGAPVTVVDVGVATDLPGVGGSVREARVASGTADMVVQAAMAAAEAQAAWGVGVDVAREHLELGADCLVGGEMGIGNTTAAAALIALLTGRDPIEVTGRGTGIDDAMWRRKVEVVRRAVARVSATHGSDLPPAVALAEVGGLEIAALAGYMTAAAEARRPVVVDGVIAAAAALVAVREQASVAGYLVAGHLSSEPGARVALDQLGLEPLLDLDLRLGEGSGALLAYPLVEASARILNEMATFESAQIRRS
jgi:nicotinate-nucleotide--dimethylbenzimidazole phosphoribosyltransferase